MLRLLKQPHSFSCRVIENTRQCLNRCKKTSHRLPRRFIQNPQFAATLRCFGFRNSHTHLLVTRRRRRRNTRQASVRFNPDPAFRFCTSLHPLPKSHETATLIFLSCRRNTRQAWVKLESMLVYIQSFALKIPSKPAIRRHTSFLRIPKQPDLFSCHVIDIPCKLGFMTVGIPSVAQKIHSKPRNSTPHFVASDSKTTRLICLSRRRNTKQAWVHDSWRLIGRQEKILSNAPRIAATLRCFDFWNNHTPFLVTSSKH